MGLSYKLKPTSDYEQVESVSGKFAEGRIRAVYHISRAGRIPHSYLAAELSKPRPRIQSASRAGQLESASSVCANPTPCGPRS